MAKRYDQYCPVAHALCLVGERWALLVVRELLHGPRRYTDIAAGLPGIGTNILASRLRDLEDAGVIRRRKLPPPAASTVYELTEYGADLKEAVYALARWGARTLGPPGPEDELYPEWGVNAFPALFNAAKAVGVAETYVLRIGEHVFTVAVENGTMEAQVGAAADADLDASMDMDTFFGLVSGDLSPRHALRDRRMQLAAGDPETLARCFTVFSLALREPVAA